MPPLGENLADSRTGSIAMQAASETTDTTPIVSIPGSSTAPSSSRLVPFPILVRLDRVQKLESEMATLLHHIHTWMQRSFIEAEERLERKIA